MVSDHSSTSHIQTISKVLSEHGSDIDAAVRKLNELRLGMEAAANDAAIKASSSGTATPPEHQPDGGMWLVAGALECWFSCTRPTPQSQAVQRSRRRRLNPG